MIRTALLQTVRCASRIASSSQLPASRSIAPAFSARPTGYYAHGLLRTSRCYSAPAGLTKQEVEGRIIDLLKGFDKVKENSQVSQTSHFANDLGLDSLDTVEVVMAIEEEFSIEIPDKEADAIHSINQAVDYILSQPDAH
ncbi:MAG: hypothetical protein Q9167_004826 [Letrouitia subvulpina]